MIGRFRRPAPPAANPGSFSHISHAAQTPGDDGIGLCGHRSGIVSSPYVARALAPLGLTYLHVGTVNTGAVDDLHGIRALADELGLWFHVDGAFGSLVAWSESRDLVAGQELADSIAFDLHKWGYMPYEVGAVLTRDAGAQLAAFGARPGSAAYLVSLKRGLTAYCDWVPSGTRRLLPARSASYAWPTPPVLPTWRAMASLDRWRICSIRNISCVSVQV